MQAHGAADGRRWYVAETKPRAESVAGMHLERQGFDVLHPLAQRARIVRGARVLFEYPIFPGYIFTAFDPEVDRWRSINGTRGVKRLMGSVDDRPPAPIRADVMAHLIDKYGAGPIDDVAEAMKQLVGKRFHVTDGPLAGLSGECEWTDGERIRVLLWLFGRSMSTTMHLGDVRPA